MLTDAHMGEGGVKICSNHAHVVYGQSLIRIFTKVEHQWPILLISKYCAFKYPIHTKRTPAF